MSAPPLPAVMMEGFLTKSSGKKNFKNWDRRYFRLNADSITYSTNARSPDLKGTILLTSIEECKQQDDVPDPNMPSLHQSFLVVTEARTYTLFADSDPETAAWCKAIKDAVTQKKAKQAAARKGSLLNEGPSTRVQRRGYISVRRSGRIQTWKKRWTILDARTLGFYKRPEDRAPDECFMLTDIDHVGPGGPVKKGKYPIALTLVSNVMELQLETQEDYDGWLTALTGVVERKRTGSTLSTGSTSSNTTAPAATTAATTTAPAPAAAATTTASPASPTSKAPPARPPRVHRPPPSGGSANPASAEDDEEDEDYSKTGTMVAKGGTKYEQADEDSPATKPANAAAKPYFLQHLAQKDDKKAYESMSAAEIQAVITQINADEAKEVKGVEDKWAELKAALEKAELAAA